MTFESKQWGIVSGAMRNSAMKHQVLLWTAQEALTIELDKTR